MLDAHLILNGLSRLAAQYYAAAHRESEEVYALSDYLARGLRAGGQAGWNAARESELLQAYLMLQRACRFPSLTATSDVTADDDTTPWPVHCGAALAQQVLSAMQLQADEPWVIRVEFGRGHMLWSFPGTRARPASEAAARQLLQALQTADLPGLVVTGCTFLPDALQGLPGLRLLVAPGGLAHP